MDIGHPPTAHTTLQEWLGHRTFYDKQINKSVRHVLRQVFQPPVESVARVSAEIRTLYFADADFYKVRVFADTRATDYIMPFSRPKMLVPTIFK